VSPVATARGGAQICRHARALGRLFGALRRRAEMCMLTIARTARVVSGSVLSCNAESQRLGSRERVRLAGMHSADRRSFQEGSPGADLFPMSRKTSFEMECRC
jgi:hypothetical protein